MRWVMMSVVRPRISLSGVSGLSTLLSGDYIGFEAGASTKKVREFTGMEIPPIITGGSAGTTYSLTINGVAIYAASTAIAKAADSRLICHQPERILYI